MKDWALKSILACAVMVMAVGCDESGGENGGDVIDCESMGVRLCELPGQTACTNGVLEVCAANAFGCYIWAPKEDPEGKCGSSTCTETCTPGAGQCNGNDRETCVMGESGCPEWQREETCPEGCSDGNCTTTCNNICEVGEKRCSGRVIFECVEENGCTRFVQTKTCESMCVAGSFKCGEDLPACRIVNGQKASILQWTDGDTLWVRVKSDGSCNEKEYSADRNGKMDWRNIRFDIRVHGIDAPECSKEQNNYYYWVCKPDSNYDDDNERLGYDSWNAANKLLPYETEVTIYCEQTQKDGTCAMDATKKRRLAYIGYEKNNATYDFSTEHARKGYAFSRTDFDCKKRKVICDAQSEAQKAKLGVWGLADTPEGVFGLMGSDKKKWLYKMPGLCKSAK